MMKTETDSSETKLNRRLISWAKRNLNDAVFSKEAKTILMLAKRDNWNTK